MWFPRGAAGAEMSTIGFLCLFLGERVSILHRRGERSTAVETCRSLMRNMMFMGSKLDAISNAAGVVDVGVVT
jgi:hypothetical protein